MFQKFPARKWNFADHKQFGFCITILIITPIYIVEQTSLQELQLFRSVSKPKSIFFCNTQNYVNNVTVQYMNVNGKIYTENIHLKSEGLKLVLSIMGNILILAKLCIYHSILISFKTYCTFVINAHFYKIMKIFKNILPVNIFIFINLVYIHE